VRKKSYDKRSEWLRNYLISEMVVAEKNEVNGNVLRLSLRKNPMSINVLDQKLVPMEYQKLIPESYTVDKKLIADHIKTCGEIPPGIEAITDRKSLQIK